MRFITQHLTLNTMTFSPTSITMPSCISIDQLVTQACASKSMYRAVENLQSATPLTLPPISDPISYFFSTKIADIGIEEYVQRLLQYAQCSDAVFVNALILLRRLAEKDPRLMLSHYNVHRLLITSVMISAKFLDHAWFSNAYYAKVGGIPSVQEINCLEIEMLKLLDYRIKVAPEEIAKLCHDIDR